ncbi:aminotransferase class I/II-fold pyridoxal phosphate-dependent enzyme [Limibaculum sp. FT325]|uniref:serine palmitoyltransferase n=1 Tax=Thermohalobaculum sediminis TaxID=2939436 RepID=UPI0020BE5C2B|nr:aminotransferase class I/II-fold pyridoxal phosphate-dependent enzyme [Limibaculum sediminis]MCL5775966.1 aminotransferase class I/II-fold pyridoxal phosphate-dependent enzyme [Limibaculum sediminis]
MGIKDRIAAVEATYGRLRALGRDPSRLEFQNVWSPTEATLEGRPMMLFGTNNYLGMTFDPEVLEAGTAATRALGSGTTGSRIANGSYGGHKALEAEITRFYAKQHCIVFSTGYVANVGMITALGGKDDVLLIDADSHASIYDGCKMADAETIRFRHNGPEDLARKLKRLEGHPGDKIIIVEGIYSMLGDTAPLAEFAAVKREAGEGVYLMVDEAHSLGVLGESGRGQCQATHVEDDCDFIVGTFSKSVGTIGGYCVSNLAGFDAIRSFCRPYMFTASMTPGTVSTARAAFRRMAERPELRARLWSNCSALYRGLGDLGFETGPEVSPVVAVKLRAPEIAVALWNRLIDEGVYTNIAIPPATPNALSLLRVSVSAAHTETQIERALNIFASVGAELGIIEPGAGRAERFHVITGGAAAKAGGRTRPAPQGPASAAATT